MNTRVLIIIGFLGITITMVSVGGFLAFQTNDITQTGRSTDYDSFEEMLISNSQTVRGVKIFLERYPDANIIIGKGIGSESHNILYRVDISSERENLTNKPFMILKATLTPEGFPEDLEMECSNGIELFIISGKNNVESSLEKNTCESEIPELNHLVPLEMRPKNENINTIQPDSTTKTSEDNAIFRVVILNPNDIDPSLGQTKIVLGNSIDDYDSGVTFSPAYVKTILNYHNVITWINKNKEPVTLESDDGYFNTKINSTESFSAVFYKIGVYKYHSPINWKRGTILVSTPEIETSNLHPAKLLEKNQYEIAKLITTSLIPNDKIVNTRLDNTIMSAYVTDEDADIIVPKSLGILNDLQTFDEIQYHYGMTKGLVFPKDEQVGLDFAKNFLEKIGYQMDGSEWIDTVNFGNRIQVTIQQKIQGWIIPNHIVQFEFTKDYTWVSLGRWYNDASQYEFKLSQDDAKNISKAYMDTEVKSRPTLQEYDYSFESIQDGVRVIIFDDKPFYMIPITYKANADMNYEVGHCGSNQFLTVYVMVEGKTGTAMGWNYPGCE